MPDTSRPKTVTIIVDGKELEAEPGELVIAAAERHGIYIPHFCYHARMSPVGMCRMCLVDIDTGRGPMLGVSCMVSVSEGMQVTTDSPTVKKAQDGVLEFLLVNHPLDCPVCDKGGECPLQDQTVAYGPGESRFVEEKRHYEKPIPISDLVYLDRERCILCDRCTRFASEVAGDPLISFTERGNQTQVLTFPDHPFASYFSGNTVQICPVGALTAAPYRFRARPWDLEQRESTCTTCSVGCRVTVQTSRDRVLRYQGVDLDPVNWGWLCDKGRFDFEAIHSDDRLGAPLVRSEADELVEASWSEALDRAAAAIATAVERGGPSSVAVLGGARLTNEDAYAWAKLAKGVIGTDNVDCQLGDGLPAEALLGLPAATIDDACGADAVVLLGPDLKEELPVLFLRLRQAADIRRVALLELAPTATGITPSTAASLRYRPGEAAMAVRALLGDAPGSAAGLSPDDLSAGRAVLERARDGRLVVVLGRASLAESPEPLVDAAAALLAAFPQARFLTTVRRGNVRGALDLGLAPGLLPGRVTLESGGEWFREAWGSVPAARGLDAAGVLGAAAQGRIGCLVLLGADPLNDFPDRSLAERGLAGAATVVAVDLFLTESSRRADVVLAAAGYAEKAGSTTNLEGRISTLGQAITPPGTARADWMLAAELSHRLGADLGIESVGAAWDEIGRVSPAHRGLSWAVLQSPAASDGMLVPLPSAPVAVGAAGEGVDAGPEAVGGPEPEAPEGLEGVEVADVPEADQPEPEAPPAAALPEVLSFSAPPAGGQVPPPDSYSLRLVAGRTLYDRGTSLRHSPSLAALARPTVLRLNPYDHERIGVSGGRLRVSSSRGSVVVAAVADAAVPRGAAVLAFGQPDVAAAELIDVAAPVTDVRVETL
ncbi:MAG: NADH-quinone oxidoreductase subunit NuoG [Acidimicrobiales bacterium]|nr:NADH-quinone oxidoreductase subunit NuoG [Acidimicrobiales bacterium]